MNDQIESGTENPEEATTEEATTEGPRYEDCVVDLSTANGNFYGIVGRVRKGLDRHLRETGMPADEVKKVIDEFTEEAESGEYDDAMQTCFRWVTVI